MPNSPCFLAEECVTDMKSSTIILSWQQRMSAKNNVQGFVLEVDDGTLEGHFKVCVRILNSHSNSNSWGKHSHVYPQLFILLFWNGKLKLYFQLKNTWRDLKGLKVNNPLVLLRIDHWTLQPISPDVRIIILIVLQRCIIILKAFLFHFLTRP